MNLEQTNPKILYVINHMDWFWSHRLPLAQGAQQAGYAVIVAAAGAGSDERLAQYGFRGLDLPASGIAKIILSLRKIIKNEQPDLVHAITLKYAFIAGLAGRLCRPKKMVFTIAGLGYLFSGNGWKPNLLRFLIAPFLKCALSTAKAQLIFQNPDDQALMIAGGFARPEQCHLIRGSGVDTAQYQPHPLPDDETPLVLMPTRLVRDKGVAVFAQAAEILLKDKKIKARFQIAGGLDKINPEAMTQGEMDDLTQRGYVIWLGKVRDMPALYRSATLIAYPSYYREGIPKVLLEAAASARPIVTTDHPGCREAVDHGENGFLVPVRDATALADAIAEILHDREKLAQMGKASRTKAEKEFDVTRIVAETLAVYG